MTLAENCAEELGISTSRLLTVAGHDSTNMNDVVPTVMLFVASHEGVTHNEVEDTSDTDAVKGVTVLTKIVEQLATTGIA